MAVTSNVLDWNYTDIDDRFEFSLILIRSNKATEKFQEYMESL